jgi:hypothetical protein
MKKVVFILFVGLMLGFCQTKTEDYPSFERSLLPYSVGQKETFVSNDNDTLITICVEATDGSYRSPGVGCVHKKSKTFSCIFNREYSSLNQYEYVSNIYLNKNSGEWTIYGHKLSEMVFYDTITIGGSLYKSVYGTTQSNLNGVSKAYFNTNGIIGFEIKNKSKIFRKLL